MSTLVPKTSQLCLERSLPLLCPSILRTWKIEPGKRHVLITDVATNDDHRELNRRWGLFI